MARPTGRGGAMKTTRTAALPDFYTHPIGSLPRPLAVIELLGRGGSGGDG